MASKSAAPGAVEKEGPAVPSPSPAAGGAPAAAADARDESCAPSLEPIAPTVPTVASSLTSETSTALPASSSVSSPRSNVVVKIGMVGDAQVGKTTLMVKYVENKFDEDYIQTLGVNFMEKSINLRHTEITFSIWDLGGQREFISMLPLVCNDAAALFFIFDLSRKTTLLSIKEWYRQARGLNRTALPFLIGTKYDLFVGLAPEDRAEVEKLARKYATAMRAPLIFTSSSHSINVQKIFKVVLSKVFDLKSTLQPIEGPGEPLLIF